MCSLNQAQPIMPPVTLSVSQHTTVRTLKRGAHGPKQAPEAVAANYTSGRGIGAGNATQREKEAALG